MPTNNDGRTPPDRDATFARSGGTQPSREAGHEQSATLLIAHLRNVAAGDTKALSELMRVMTPRLSRVARSITNDDADAEEAVYDAWRQVWRHAAAFDPERASVHAWLTSIVQRQAIDIVRRRGVRERFECPADSPVDIAIQSADPARGLEAEQGLSALHNALLRLTTRRRTVMRLALVEQRSQSEIARQTGAPLGTVKTRMRNALQFLRKIVSEH